MRIVISTRSVMTGGLHCVVGVDQNGGVLRRLQNASGYHRQSQECDELKLWPGSAIDAEPIHGAAVRPPPHGREDTWVANVRPVAMVRVEAFHRMLWGLAKPTIGEAFSPAALPPKNGPWAIRVGTQVPSFGLVSVRPRRAKFLYVQKEDRTWQKRMTFTTCEADGNRYWNLPVTSAGLSEYWRLLPERTDEINVILRETKRMVVQIGFAHPGPDGLCYAMAVGVTLMGVDGAPLS